MHFFRFFLMLSLVTGLASAGFADTTRTTNGSDSFVAGGALSETLEAERDAFVGGRAVVSKGAVKGDLHVAGFDVDVETDTGADLYAAGATVSLRAPVGEDASAIGMTVRIAQDAEINGNARLMGETVTIDGRVGGALTALGREVVLNSVIAGDAWITARRISFGPNAKITGRLLYSSENEISVPERVVDPAKVTFEKLTEFRLIRDVRRTWEMQEYPVLPSFLSMLAGFLVTLALIVIMGAIFLTFMPKPVERMRTSIAAKPGQVVLVGIVGLSILFGMVPITALTIVGIPLVPIILLSILLVWFLGYILGAYAVAVRVWQAFNADAELTKVIKLLILAAAVIIVAILNFIPFVGWVANYTLVLLGTGAMTTVLFEWMIGNAGPAHDVDMNPIEDS